MSDDVDNRRTEAQMVFDEMSARTLGEMVRMLARDRGVKIAAASVSFDEDRGMVRVVVCAPIATSEADFGLLVGRTVVDEINKAGKR